MSEKIESLTIEPPCGMSYESARSESFKTEIKQCPVCSGNGGKWNDQHSLRGEGWQICSMCKGSGKIQGTVTIIWSNVGEPKEIFKHEKE